MAADKTIELSVITPEQQVLEARVESAVIPAHDGELGVLFNRAPLVCELGIGQLRYRSEGRTYRMFIDGGFAQVYRNRLTVLSDRALTPEQIDDATIDAFDQQARDAQRPAAQRAADRRRAAVLRSICGR